MNRKEAFLRIKEAANDCGFTKLDVMPFFRGVAPSDVERYIETAYNLGFIMINAKNALCMYPTQKLKNLK